LIVQGSLSGKLHSSKEGRGGSRKKNLEIVLNRKRGLGKWGGGWSSFAQRQVVRREEKKGTDDPGYGVGTYGSFGSRSTVDWGGGKKVGKKLTPPNCRKQGGVRSKRTGEQLTHNEGGGWKRASQTSKP